MYIERLLQRQAQMAARIERQSAPTLRLYPETVWLERTQTVQSEEDDAMTDGAEELQANAAEEVYRQLVRLESAHGQMRAAFRQAEEAVTLTPTTESGADEVSAFLQRTSAPVRQTERAVFGNLPQGQASRLSMERISRFFERDARRYGG